MKETYYIIPIQYNCMDGRISKNLRCFNMMNANDLFDSTEDVFEYNSSCPYISDNVSCDNCIENVHYDEIKENIIEMINDPKLAILYLKSDSHTLRKVSEILIKGYKVKLLTTKEEEVL